MNKTADLTLLQTLPAPIVMVSAPFTWHCFSGFPTWMTRIGGVSKEELHSRLQEAGVLLNDAAQALFADARFTTSAVSYFVQTVQVSVAALGFPEGATFAKLIERATTNGLLLCPLELGPHLRLQFTDQPEGFIGQPASQHCAPPGSVTVAAEPLAEDWDCSAFPDTRNGVIVLVS